MRMPRAILPAVSRKPATVTLTVERLYNDDHWKDIARIPWRHRTDSRGRTIKPPTICTVTVGSKSKRLSIRGWDETDDPVILLDRTTRLELGVEIGQTYEVALKPVTLVGSWIWACRSADPAYRFPAQMSLISLALGVISLALGVIAFLK